MVYVTVILKDAIIHKSNTQHSEQYQYNYKIYIKIISTYITLLQSLQKFLKMCAI